MSYSSEVLADSPLAYWRLGEASGTTMVDASGNAHDGTYANVTLAQTGALSGDSDTAGAFNGSSSKATVADAAWLHPSALTVEAWVKANTTTPSTSQYIASKTNLSTVSASNYQSILYQASGTANVGFIVTNSSGTQVTATTTGSLLSDLGWHHVVGTFDGTNVRIYVDGTQVAITALSGTLATGGTNAFVIGNSATGSRWFNGLIDEVAYYGSALSAARVTAHYSAGSPHPTAALAATFPKPTVALSGTYREVGSFTATMPRVVVALSGNYIARETGSVSASMPKPTVALSGTYTPPANPSGTFDARMPILVVSLAGDYHPHETGSLAATLLVPSVSLAGTYADPPHPTGSLDLTLPIPVVALSGTYTGPIPTDLSNALDGLDLLLTATVIVAVPVVAPPASVAAAMHYDKAIAYPTPVMVGGRPT